MYKMQVNLKLFGITKDIIGNSELAMTLAEGTNVNNFVDLLKSKYPSLCDLSSMLVAVNSEYATPDILLNNNDEIAFIPPVSGG
jgi:molybdopterin synthase sulfur carrier subunit